MNKLNDTTYISIPKSNPKDLIQKEVGDSKTLDTFLPQQKIMRWDNEVNVSIRLVHDEKNPTVTTEGEKVIWKGDKVEAHFYDINNKEHSEGASEFEVVLKEKPDTNVVEFTLVDKDVEYFYQPALTPEEIAQGSQRPENVIGSYAVYAKTPKTNWTGGKEYKCGKVGHIFRPKIIDSAGTEVWGDLHIENGILSVTIPQEFLDKAVYPVRHAAGLTFGYTGVGLTTDNRAYSFGSVSSAYIHTGATGETVTKFSLYADTVGSFDMAVYTVNATPYFTTRLATPVTITIAAAAGWNDSSAVSQSLANGVKYGVASGVKVNSRVRYKDATSTADNCAATNGLLNNPFDYDSNPNVRVSQYATYTAGGGGADTTKFFF